MLKKILFLLLIFNNIYSADFNSWIISETIVTKIEDHLISDESIIELLQIFFDLGGNPCAHSDQDLSLNLPILLAMNDRAKAIEFIGKNEKFNSMMLYGYYDSYSALMWACKKARLETVKALVELRAYIFDTNKSKNGDTPISLAESRKDSEGEKIHKYLLSLTQTKI